MRGGAGPSTTLSGRGSTGLKALTSSTVKARSSEEDEKPLARGSNSTPAGKPKLANHLGAGGPWVRGILRNGSDDTVAESNGSTAKKSRPGGDEELLEWIPSRNSSTRISQRSSNYSEESSALEFKHHGNPQGEPREEPRRRGLCLRDWKGGFVRDENLDSATAQEMKPSDGSRRSVESRPASAPVRRAPPRVVKGSSPLPSPGGQRGVKENCDRFRRQMKFLKEKSEDTRMREEEVENMAERLQRRLVDEIDLDGEDIWRNSTQIHVEEEPEEFCEFHRAGKASSSFHTGEQPLERTSLESLNRTMTRLMNGDYSDPSTPPVDRPEKKIKMTRSISGSSSSSQASLPLSHYIQKLRDARLKNSGASQHRFEAMEHKFGAENGDGEFLPMAVARTDSNEWRELSLSLPGSSPAILLPTSSSTGSPKLSNHRHPPPPQFSNRLKSQAYHNRITKPDSSSVAVVRTSPHGQHLTTISNSGAMVAARHLQDGEKLQDKQAPLYPPDESRAHAMSRSIYEVRMSKP